MALELLVFLPALLLLVLANYTEKHKDMRILTQVFLGLTVAAIIAEGIVIVAMGDVIKLGSSAAYGYGTIIMGVISILFFLKPVRKQAARVMDIDPENWLHATALVFAVLFAGMTIVMSLSLDISSLADEIDLDLVSVILQGVVFVLAALFGVGGWCEGI